MRRTTRAWLVAACVAAGALPAAMAARDPVAAATMGATRAPIDVGSVRLAPCPDGSGFYCGTLQRALDPSGVVAGSVDVAYRWLPRSSQSEPARGTLIGIEGGPGYGSTSDGSEFRALFGSLLETRNLLAVDARGTGGSGVIDCQPLQGAAVVTAEDVGACGRQLGERADLYGAQLAAADMAAILDTLGVREIDLYGKSYGTFAAQVFAGNYPDRVRTIVLEGVYDALSTDPWYSAALPGSRNAFRLACERSPPCSGDPITRLEVVLGQLRADPAAAPHVRRGSAHGPLRPADLAFVTNIAGESPLVFVELDAALRAYARKDTAPLVRIVNEAYAYQEGTVGAPAREYSMGQMVATSCADLPQAYDMSLPVAKRRAAFEAAIAARSSATPGLYAPFTVEEWAASPPDWSFLGLCLNWPVASARHPHGQLLPPGAQMPDVPALLLTGDLDTVTTVGEGDQAAARYARAQRVIIPSAGHAVALYSTPSCAVGIVREFIASGGAPVDASCVATMVPPPRLLPVFASRLAGVPAAIMAGARPADLKAAAAAVYSAADVANRNRIVGRARGAGLRGGSFRTERHSGALRLHAVRWTADLAVAGRLMIDAATGAVAGRLSLGGNATGDVKIAWQTQGPQGVATIDGMINGRRVRATMPAP